MMREKTAEARGYRACDSSRKCDRVTRATGIYRVYTFAMATPLAELRRRCRTWLRCAHRSDDRRRTRHLVTDTARRHPFYRIIHRASCEYSRDRTSEVYREYEL